MGAGLTCLNGGEELIFKTRDPREYLADRYNVGLDRASWHDGVKDGTPWEYKPLLTSMLTDS